MKVYFVRHGESEQQEIERRGGVEYWQGAWGALTQKGRQEATRAAEFFKRRGVSVILSSPYDRTRQTAEVIAAQTGQKVATTPLLIERRNPKEIVDKKENEPGVAEIASQLKFHFHDSGWHYSDEENWADLQDRARETIAYLRARSDPAIVVVTHAMFLRAILLSMQIPKYDSADFKFIMKTRIKNCQVVKCDYRKGKWNIRGMFLFKLKCFFRKLAKV